MFSDATDELIVTAGNAGLYIAWLYGFLTLPTAGGYVRAALRTGGATVQTGVMVPTFAGLTSYFALSVVLQLADANAVSAWLECSAGNFPTVTVQRFGIARMGSAFGTLLAELGPEAQPADA
jgi:hypothetical protein